MEGGFTMTTLLESMSTFFTSLVSWFGTLIDFFVGEPVLFVFLLISLAGVVIGMVRRWLPGRG